MALSEPVAMTTPPAVPVSICTPVERAVASENGLVPPRMDGFTMPPRIRDLGPGALALPPLRVTVTVWPDTDTVPVPVMFPKLVNVAPDTSKNAGNVTMTLPSLGSDDAVVKLTYALVGAWGRSTAGVTFVEVRAPVAMVTAAAVPWSMSVPSLSVVESANVPVAPVVAGLTMPLSTTVLAPAALAVPSLLRVMVTVWPDTDAVAVPSIPVALAKAAPLTSKPAGKVTRTLPSAGMGLAEVKATVTFGVSCGSSVAGVTEVDDSAPGVSVTPDAVPVSMAVPPAVFTATPSVPLAPLTPGFATPMRVTVFAPAAGAVPAWSSSSSTVWATLSMVAAPTPFPAKPVVSSALLAPVTPCRSKVVGKVNSSCPSFVMACCSVKLMATLVDAPATRLAGVYEFAMRGQGGVVGHTMLAVAAYPLSCSCRPGPAFAQPTMEMAFVSVCTTVGLVMPPVSVMPSPAVPGAMLLPLLPRCTVTIWPLTLVVAVAPTPKPLRVAPVTPETSNPAGNVISKYSPGSDPAPCEPPVQVNVNAALPVASVAPAGVPGSVVAVPVRPKAADAPSPSRATSAKAASAATRRKMEANAGEFTRGTSVEV